MSKLERRINFQNPPGGKVAIRLFQVNLGRIGEPLLGFPLRRQGVGRNRANFRDPSRRPAIEQWPVERVIHARIGQ